MFVGIYFILLVTGQNVFTFHETLENVLWTKLIVDSDAQTIQLIGSQTKPFAITSIIQIIR